MVRPVDVRPSAGKSEKPDLMWNAGKHNRDSDSTPRPARSKSVKSEKKSRKKNSKRFSGGNFSFFASFLSNSSLKSSRSLPLSAEKRRTLDDGDNVARRDYRRVWSWSHYLESYGGQRAVEAAENWMVDMSQLFIGNKFASGTHSRIYRGIYRQKPVAVKMMMQPEGDESVAVLLEKQFTCEVALLSRLRHPNIIEFVAACKKPPVFCIIIEYLSEGSLRTYLHKQEPHSLPLKLVLKIALDVARGMQYLHSQGVIHRDLKSENLLLDDDMHVKVADFGVSCLECQCDHMKGFMGTYRWMAPEMINEKPYTRKVDVYSYGIVLWELLTALIPFQEMTPVQAAFAVSQKNARPPLPTACPLAFRHLIQQCWSTNPDKRPDFNHIVSVLERYDESLKEDPAFFFNYKPTQQHILFRCFKSCVSISSATSVQA